MARRTRALLPLGLLALASCLAVGAWGQTHHEQDWGKYENVPYYFPTIDCPKHPRALCDFYFDGYENIVPTFHLDDGVTSGDHALVPVSRESLHWMGDMTHFSPTVKEYLGDNFVLANTRNATFLKYPDGTYDADWAEKTFDQFYLNHKTDAKSHLYTRSWQQDKEEWGQRGRVFFQKKCVFLPFSTALLQGSAINLNYGDNNTAYAPQRRCVVFTTDA